MRMVWLKCCFVLLVAGAASGACSKGKGSDPVPPPTGGGTGKPDGLINAAHLKALTVPVSFSGGTGGVSGPAYGVYIYANAPDYKPAVADGEGFTCVDDVARAAQFYLRDSAFATDTAMQNRAFGLIRFLLNMQSGNGYFFNFLQTGNLINVTGNTSVNQAKWWSWRALQALAEGSVPVRGKNAALADQMDAAVTKLVARIQTDLVNLPQVTSNQNGIDVPQWLPEGADQAATLILGLIPYCNRSGDAAMKQYVKKLADGIVLLQQGDASHFPYGCFLSAGNLWHAWGSDQAHALFATAKFLNDTAYSNRALTEVTNFYPWLILNGYKYSFEVTKSGGVLTPQNVQNYEQIAYGFRPLVSAATDAYLLTGDPKYADLAGKLASWLFGRNIASTVMYDMATGRCFDAIGAGNTVNKNAGAESCIEALLTLQTVQAVPGVLTVLNKYRQLQ